MFACSQARVAPLSILPAFLLLTLHLSTFRTLRSSLRTCSEPLLLHPPFSSYSQLSPFPIFSSLHFEQLAHLPLIRQHSAPLSSCTYTFSLSSSPTLRPSRAQAKRGILLRSCKRTNSSPNDRRTFAEPGSGSANSIAQELRSSEPPDSRAQPHQAFCLPDSRIDLRLHSYVIIGPTPVLPDLCTTRPEFRPTFPALRSTYRTSRSLTCLTFDLLHTLHPTHHPYYMYIPCDFLMLQYLYTVASPTYSLA